MISKSSNIFQTKGIILLENFKTFKIESNCEIYNMKYNLRINRIYTIKINAIIDFFSQLIYILLFSSSFKNITFNIILFCIIL